VKRETTIRRDRVRIYIFSTMSLMSIVMFYSLLFNNNSPRVTDAMPYLLIGNALFMAITTMCALAKSFYIGKSYDMDHVWIFPTIGFNGKSMYIIWLRWEIFVTY